MIDMDALIKELDLVDQCLGLPDGTTASAIADHSSDNLVVLNDRLSKYGIVIANRGFMEKQHRPLWTELLKGLGVSRAWWMDGDPSIADLSKPIRRICT